MRVMQGCATRNKGGIPQVVNLPSLERSPAIRDGKVA